MTEEDKLSAAVDSTLNIKFILFSLLDFFLKNLEKICILFSNFFHKSE